VIHAKLKGAALLMVVGGTGLGLLSGCSPASSNVATKSAAPTQGTPSNSATAKTTTSAGSSAAPAAAGGECTKVSILAALPAGLTMDKFQCAIASPSMWAAARVKPGPTVFFLQTTSGPWKVSTAKQICGKPPAGLPKEIQAFCPKA